MIRKQCLPWVTVPHGQTGDRQMRPVYPRCSRCSPWLTGSDMKCDQNRGFRSQPRTGLDYSRIKCFSCGQFGHMQSHCPQRDTSLPFKPAGWFLQSDSRQQRNGDNQAGNSP